MSKTSEGDAQLHAREIHASHPAIDLHADPLLWERFVGYDINERHRPPLPYAWLGGHIDVPRMLEGGVGGQFFGLVSLPILDVDHARRSHKQIDALEEVIRQSKGKLTLATSGDDVRAAANEGRVAALIGMEGAHPLRGELSRLDVFAKRGLRYLGLLHFAKNECGHPAAGYGASKTKGLTRFGKEVVQRCEELGVIVDLAHTNRPGFFDAIEIATKPLIVSHTGLLGAHESWRNIDDEQLRAVANSGGVVGVIFCPQFLGSPGIEGVVKHLRHIVNIVGEDHAALGSDWDGFIRPTKGLEEASKLPNLTAALIEDGFSERAITKILRDNALRVLDEVQFAATPSMVT